MYSIDEVEQMLNKAAEELPEEFYRELNGGIVLLPECKRHPKGAGDLFIMGEYNNRHDMGRYICIYYGSFMRLYGNSPEEVLYRELRKTLRHEFTHHIESLAGETRLEIKDAIQLEEYKRIHRGE